VAAWRGGKKAGDRHQSRNGNDGGEKRGGGGVAAQRDRGL